MDHNEEYWPLSPESKSEQLRIARDLEHSRRTAVHEKDIERTRQLQGLVLYIDHD